jgi:hypothetical protein
MPWCCHWGDVRRVAGERWEGIGHWGTIGHHCIGIHECQGGESQFGFVWGGFSAPDIRSFRAQPHDLKVRTSPQKAL